MPGLYKIILVVAYLFSIVTYIGQGILYDGTWYTMLAGAYVLLFNMYCTIRYAFLNNHQPMFPIQLLFLVWIVIVWAISEKSYTFWQGNIKTFNMVFYMLYVCTSFYSFYFLTCERMLTQRVLMPFLFLLSVIFIYNVLHYDVGSLEAGEYDYSSANNKAYPLTALMPFCVAFWRKKWLMFLLMISFLFFIVLCLKRGAMLCAASYLFISFFYAIKQNLHKSVRHSILILIIASVVLLFLSIIFMDIYDDNIFLQGRFDHGSDSREFIYTRIVDGFLSSDLYGMIVGNGPFSTITVGQNYAHNDWLEMLYDYGIIGFLLYIMIPLSIFYFYKTTGLSYESKSAVMMCLSYIMIRSSFSMCIYELESLLIWALLGHIYGKVVLSRNIEDSACKEIEKV